MYGDTLLLGTRKGLLIFKKKGTSWEAVKSHFPGVPVSYAMVDPRNGVMWACADHGHWAQKLYRADHIEAEFEEIPVPKYPEDAIMYEPWNDGAEKPATLSYLWTIVPGGADQPDTLYIGTEPGGVFRTDDRGESFTLVEGLWHHPSRRENWFGGGRDQAGACSILVDPRDSNHLFVGVSVGGVYESTNGGVTWAGRNQGLIASYLPDPHAEYGHDVHCITLCPTQPDVLWQQNHCGVFHSTDAGRHWTDVSHPDDSIKFGFPIVADEKNPDTAWVVPGISDDQRMAVGGALTVGRTDDAGKTWTILRNGLPQTHCYDIVLRHGLDIAGNQLAFGSTTGNVFISDNWGDTWQGLGNYYPPVYSVRFA